MSVRESGPCQGPRTIGLLGQFAAIHKQLCPSSLPATVPFPSSRLRRKRRSRRRARLDEGLQLRSARRDRNHGDRAAGLLLVGGIAVLVVLVDDAPQALV